MLHVWLRAQHSPLAVWHTISKQWHTVDNWQQLHDIYSIHGHKSLCLYFPSQHMLQVETTLNGSQLKQLGVTGKQYLFEEVSLAAVEQLVIRQLSYANTSYLFALAESDIEAWQQSAQLAGLSIHALLPDFLLLPIPEEGAGQQVVLYQDSYTTLLRQSADQGLAGSYLPLIFDHLPQLSEVCILPKLELSADTVAEVLTATIDDESMAQADLRVGKSISEETAALLTERQLLISVLPLVPTPMENSERHALNFFTKSSSSQLSPYLRVAMMVALSALVLQIATDAVQWYRYHNAATATQAEIAAQYQSWFPNENLSTRTKLQVQLQPKLLNDTQSPASHMAILSRITPLIKQSSLQAQVLSVQPTSLSFTLIAPDRQSLDEFTNMLTAQGITANLQQVNSNEQGQFSGQITVILSPDNSADSKTVTAETAT